MTIELAEQQYLALLFCVPQGPNLILEADCRTAEGLARLFSSMLELGELQHQIQMRQQAELRALRSQIDPHFLFNALSTVSALCTTDPQKAKEMILVLANYFRQAMQLLEKKTFDFPFIDVRLGDMEGTTVASLARRLMPEAKIIFATAYSEYAVTAFELQANDYILKPYDPARVRGSSAELPIGRDRLKGLRASLHIQ